MDLEAANDVAEAGPIGRLYVNGNAIGAKAAVRFLAEEEKTSTYVYQRDLVDGGGAAPDEPMPPEKLSFDLVAAALPPPRVLLGMLIRRRHRRQRRGNLLAV